MNLALKWLGHASFQIDAKGMIIYIDPSEGDYTKKADVILVTHSHYDHCDASKIRKIRDKNTVVIAPEDCVSKIGGDIKVLNPGEKTTVGYITVSATQAYNNKRFKSPGTPFHPKGFGVGYLIMTDGKTIYHAGDTDFIPEMKQLGHVDLALIPSGGTYTMDNPDAARATLAINPKIVIPMHLWDTDPAEFKKKVEANSQIKVVVLEKDQKYSIYCGVHA